jgi:hypothetical protein
MKKNKLSPTKRKAAIKRGEKRSARLKKTQAEKHVRKSTLLAEKKNKDRKFRETMQKLLESRGAQQPGL